MKRILILYTSVGMGHQAIAKNIGYHLKRDGHTVQLSDIADVQPGLFARLVIPTHQFINKRLPFIWGWLYRWGHYALLPVRVFIPAFSNKKTRLFIDEFKPDLIITTQTTASAVVAYLKKTNYYRGLFGIAFSDYHFHPYWVYSQADFYLANIEQQKQEILKLSGAQGIKIFVCGMTMKPKPEIDVKEVRARLDIGLDEKVIVIASGSLGTAMPGDWVMNLASDLVKAASTKYKTSVIILCGKNQELLERLQKQPHDPQIKIFGLYSPFAELCALANVFLTKPGGMSIAEGLQWNLPMLITHWLPGQEALNYQYLQQNRLIMPGPANVRSMKSAEIVARVMRELETDEFRKSLSTSKLRLELVQSEFPVPAAQAVKQMFHDGLTG